MIGIRGKILSKIIKKENKITIRIIINLINRIIKIIKIDSMIMELIRISKITKDHQIIKIQILEMINLNKIEIRRRIINNRNNRIVEIV